MAFVDRSVAAPISSSLGASRFSTIRTSALPVETLTEPATRDRLRDLIALTLLAVCAFLLSSLATFDPADPPAARMFPPHAQAMNACGSIGSAAALSLYQCFGLGAWFVVGLIVAFTATLLKRHTLTDLPLRTGGGVVAAVGVCTLLALFLPDWVGRPLWGPGGYCGATGRMFAEAYCARTGAAIVVTGITGAGLFLACDALLLGMAAVFTASVSIAWLQLMFLGSLFQAGSRTVSKGFPERLAASNDAVDANRPSSFDIGNSAQADDDDDDGALVEPTIRVRRRKQTLLNDEDAGLLSQKQEEESAFAAETVDEPVSVVPIRTLSSRRRKAEVLDAPLAAPVDYELPTLDLLLPSEQLQLDSQEQEVRERARILEKTFADFGFKVRVVEIETGPVISQYEIELEAGLRLAKISNLADDLAIALRVPSVRIVAPIPGKNSVGIEVPNTDRQMVRLREVIEETQSKTRTMKIPIYLGKDVAGNPMVVDMASLPHLLIAGRTGTGKSVCLNSIIVSMLMSRRPDEVRMLMIDPKMVELTPYKSLPHLMHPVVTDMKKAEAILGWAVEKMEERYTLLAKVGVRHLSQYNQLGREELLRRLQPDGDEAAEAIPTTMPYIVVIADEIADMMMTAGKEIEQHIIRLAQKSRAVGIHLVLATQKPTVDVITGLIKSNLPARIAFQVASRTDSRVVLDECGADRLLGNGDMLFLSPGTSTIVRGQGTYVSDEEIGRVMAAIGTSTPEYAQELVNLQPAPAGDAQTSTEHKMRDDLYEAAVEVVIREGRGSVSLLQRVLGVGYGRGARLIDFMAEDGVVGQYAGSQAREVLLTMDQWAQRNGLTDLVPDSAPRRLKIQPHASANADVAITARRRDAPELAQDKEFEDSQHASARSHEHCRDDSFANSHDDER